MKNKITSEISIATQIKLNNTGRALKERIQIGSKYLLHHYQPFLLSRSGFKVLVYSY